jgi:FixJ family two-component response regulator
MPLMGGGELASRLMAVRPTTKVIFTSGYTDRAFARAGAPGVALIDKPFTPAVLGRAVRDALDGPAPRIDDHA